MVHSTTTSNGGTYPSLSSTCKLIFALVMTNLPSAICFHCVAIGTTVISQVQLKIGVCKPEEKSHSS